jgi:hypothetical protein
MLNYKVTKHRLRQLSSQEMPISIFKKGFQSWLLLFAFSILESQVVGSGTVVGSQAIYDPFGYFGNP